MTRGGSDQTTFEFLEGQFTLFCPKKCYIVFREMVQWFHYFCKVLDKAPVVTKPILKTVEPLQLLMVLATVSPSLSL